MMAVFSRWMDQVDALGQKHRIFDPPDLRVICGELRRPYRGKDGFFFEAFQSGMSPRQALAEALVEQDCA